MSSPERSLPPEDYVSRLESLLRELQEQTWQINAAEAARRQTWSDVSGLVKEFGVTEEAKFAVAAFGGYPTDPEKNKTYVEWLRAMDEQIKISAGESLAWLTSEVVETSHPFNPAVKPDTENRVALHIGQLPQDAQLIVEAHGRVLVPVEKSVAIPISSVYMSDRPFIDDELIPIGAVTESSASLEPNPKLELFKYGPDDKTPIVFGDKAVEELLDKNELGAHPQVAEALETLIAT